MLKRLKNAFGNLFLAPRPIGGRLVQHYDPDAGLLRFQVVDEDGATLDTSGDIDSLAKPFERDGRRVVLNAELQRALAEIAAHGCRRGGPNGFAVRDENGPDLVRALTSVGVQLEVAPSSPPFSFNAQPLSVQKSAELEGDDALRRTTAFADAEGRVVADAKVVAAQADQSWIRTPNGFRRRPKLTREEIHAAAEEAEKPVISGDEIPYFLAKALAEAKRDGRRIVLGPRAAAARVVEDEWMPSASVDVRDDQLLLDVNMHVADLKIPLAEAEAAGKRRYVRVRGRKDTWAKNDQLAAKRTREALDAIPRLEKLEGTNGFKAPISSLPVVQEQFAEIGRVSLSEAATRLFAQLRDFSQIEEAPIPTGLRAQLRPYQRKGLDWLCFLRRYGFGGILADDMGLGKTLQTCSALLAAADAGATDASLVVCPASVLSVWKNEILKWCDGLTPVILDASNRKKYLRSPPPRTVAIASYQAVQRSADEFRTPLWNYLVMDEAHRVKNHNTGTAKACKDILARHKLAVTGTPIQNKLSELWAIYDSIMPDYLGSKRDFDARFERPIEKERSEPAAERLRQRIEPFKLRRMKTEVAKDLPPLTRELRPVRLLPKQKEIYMEITEQLRLPDTLSQIRTGSDVLKGLAKLLRLRQVCAHPRLVDPNADLRGTSAKLEELDALLRESLDGGHKALIFTQWVEMATILREYFSKEQISYLYLDGSMTVPARQEVVEQFQRHEGPPVLLVSLLAGGEGITLTEADTVIMYDRWWNPAVEEQAIARAYRIGQRRPVTGYILQAVDTIEERIAAMLEHKQGLAEDLVRIDSFEKNITRDQLIALFEGELQRVASSREDASSVSV